ncbi:MAG: PAC2 family protein [Pirellulaceae bacterium]|nr:PAC2 family protein [Pirellulaceae bacterium]
MLRNRKLNHPWLVAVWPGMGNVALSAGYYLLAKLGMYQLAEFTAGGLFDVDQIEVKDGLILPPERPRSRFYAWQSPEGVRDLVVFIGEAQPPLGKFSFCESLVDYALDLGVEQVFTFAAMATQMHPHHDSRVFGAATHDDKLQTLQVLGLQVEMLDEGHIGGLNGVLLGVAAEKGLPGICLLGEMPHVFAQLPFPKASLAVLKVFAQMANIHLDFSELAEQAQEIERRLGEFLAKMEQRLSKRESVSDETDEFTAVTGEEAKDEEQLSDSEKDRIEALFRASREDRSKAYELKKVLDEMGVFAEFEDRFLDLFKDQT